MLVFAIAVTPCVEFGFRRRRVRKSKASLGWMRARRAQHYTHVCASPGNEQTAQNRRRLFRTEFAIGSRVRDRTTWVRFFLSRRL